MSEELKSKFEAILNKQSGEAILNKFYRNDVIKAMQAAYNMAKADGWVSVVNSGAIPPKENTWYQCAKYSRQLEEYVIMLLPYQFDKVRGFIAYTENHTDNSVTHYREFPTPPNQ